MNAHAPVLAAPIDLAVEEATTGYAIIITKVDNRRPDKTAAQAIIVWPATPEGYATRETVYDAVPKCPVSTNQAVEWSLDNVGPCALDIAKVTRISAETAAVILARVAALDVETGKGLALLAMDDFLPFMRA